MDGFIVITLPVKYPCGFVSLLIGLKQYNMLNIEVSVVNDMVVFQIGRILQRDRDRSRAMVQLDRYEEKVFTLDYDSICHYVGGGDH